jgi:hypothetical protein
MTNRSTWDDKSIIDDQLHIVQSEVQSGKKKPMPGPACQWVDMHDTNIHYIIKQSYFFTSESDNLNETDLLILLKKCESCSNSMVFSVQHSSSTPRTSLGLLQWTPLTLTVRPVLIPCSTIVSFFFLTSWSDFLELIQIERQSSSSFNLQLLRTSLGLLQWTPPDHRSLTSCWNGSFFYWYR